MTFFLQSDRDEMVFSWFCFWKPLTVFDFDDVSAKLIFLGAIEKSLPWVETIYNQLVVLVQIARCASEHEIVVLMAFPRGQLTVEMVNLIVRGMAEIVGVQTIRTTLFEIMEQMRKGLLAVSRPGHF